MVKEIPAKRLKLIPPYLFAEVDRLKEEAKKQWDQIIDLGVGDPDSPTPNHIIEALQTAANDPANHQYASYSGMRRFREAISNWYKERFGVLLDPEQEVVSLIGSKEGIAHIPLGLVNPGEIVLVPDPGYPVYQNSTILAGGEPYTIPLKEKNGFLPELENIPEEVLKKTKLMFLNYPNNPTSAVCTLDFFEKVVDFAKRHNIIVCHDAAYTEIYFDNEPPPSFLQVPGAKDVGVEFHSLSKTYNMTGWRIGFAVGNQQVLSCLLKIKTNIDSGIFQAIQEAGITALSSTKSIDCVESLRKLYQERRDLFLNGLRNMGLRAFNPKATFYVWIPTPKGLGSMDFTIKLIKEAGIVTTPGIGFGSCGEGYIRVALTVDKETLIKALNRMEKVRL